MRSGVTLLLLVVSVLVLVACAPQAHRQIDTLRRADAATPRVVLMPMDVQVSELTIGGMLEPKADWTQNAEANIRAAVEAEMAARGATFSVYRADATDTARLLQEEQILKLHEAVGSTIIAYRSKRLELPHRRGVEDWSLGSSVKVLGERYGANYALFVFARDSHSSSGRIATEAAKSVAIAVLTLGAGVYVPRGGVQVGFASLVDLNTGDLVWFNHLARNAGDFRERDDAQSSVKLLLDGFPS